MRKRVIFKGMVQGVGFRYTAQMIARGFAVTGSVKNLPDGTVQLITEGERSEIREFLDEIKERKGVNIRSVSEVAEPETGEFTDFGIDY